METKLLITTVVFAAGFSYLSIVRHQLIPKTVQRLKTGYYPYPKGLEIYKNKNVYREKDINQIQKLITNQISNSKYYIITGRKGCVMIINEIVNNII